MSCSIEAQVRWGCFAGDVIAKQGDTTGTVGTILATLQLTAGQSPVDIGEDSGDGMLVVSYTDSAVYEESVSWTQQFVGYNDTDDVLEQHEKVQITITVPDGAKLLTNTTAVNQEFRIELKPKVGAILPFTRITPPQIDAVMNLR